MTSKHTSQGQIIVLFALVLVGLLAFTGLAIDGAMVYSDRRGDQSAADSASMAGAGAGASYIQLRDVNYSRDFNCSDLNISGSKLNRVKHEIIDAAISRASANGITIDGDISDGNGVRVSCFASSFDKYLEVEVQVTTQTKTSFLHLVSSQPLMNTVIAITRIRPTRPAAGGFAIAATNPNNCGQRVGGIYFDGKVDVVLDGGGAYSATCIVQNGNAGTIRVLNSDPGVARTEIVKAHFIDANGNVKNPVIDSSFMLDVSIPAPNCTGMPTFSSPNYNKELEPGIYPNGISKTAKLKPGLYCIDKDMTTGNVPSISGTGVTLYFRNGASFKIAGKEALALIAPMPGAPAVSNAVPGLLMYFDTGGFEMVGTSDVQLVGTIYAPKGEVKLGAASAMIGNLTTEIIADNIKIHGNPEIRINYDSSRVYSRPPTLDLVR